MGISSDLHARVGSHDYGWPMCTTWSTLAAEVAFLARAGVSDGWSQVVSA